MRRRVLVALTFGLLCGSALAAGAEPDLDLGDTSRLRIGIGDRMRLERGDRWVRTLDEIRQRGVAPDFVQAWLPRGWEDSWISAADLEHLAESGVVPVVVHYFFGDFISKERVLSQREEWWASLDRMAERIRMSGPVLVLLEPEFNIAPPPGETAITRWPGFAEELRSAVRRVRERAPNARVGVCVGDFAGTPYLEPVLAPVASELDFLAFQEMRGATAAEAGSSGYVRVGEAATSFARYLKRAFGRPLLIGYVAVSSHARWEDEQAHALADLRDHAAALRQAGVFGWIYFQLFDDPEHEGYFGAAEKHFGLIRADGRPKPAFEIFRDLAR